jgi:hypothetical protein
MQIDLKDVKKGDIFYECQYGINLKCTALEDCREEEDGYHCYCLIDHETMKKPYTEMFESYNCGAYGLRLYTQPQYVEIDKIWN